MRPLLGLLVLAAARAQEAPHLAVETPKAARVSVAEALTQGVAWLVASQNADGSFGTATVGRPWEILADVPGSHEAFRAATTALCWMALRDGPRTAASSEAARRALGWLADHVRVKRPNGLEMYNMWSHTFGLQAIAQAIREEADGASPERLRAVGRGLIDACALYQTLDGGITYLDFAAQSFRPSGSSMSFTTATMLVALRDARDQGLDVPEKLVARAVKSLRTCRKEDGSYLYGPYLRYVPNHGVNQPKGSSLRTQTCNLALWLWQAGVSDDDLRSGLRMLEEHWRFAIAALRRPIPHESWYSVSGYFYLYGLWYAALVLDRLPEADRLQWYPFLVRATLQAREPDGSFWDYPIYGYGKAYGTAFAVLTLARCPAEVAAATDGHEAGR